MDVASNGGLNGVQRSKEKGMEAAHATGYGLPELALRVLALLLTVAAAILLGLDKQTKMISLQISPNLPAFNVPLTAKSSYLSGFVYFVVVNSIASVFAAASLALTFASNGGRKAVSRLMIIVTDLMMVALLFSGIGAASAVGVIGLKGNSHLQWKKVCNVYGKYCHQGMASVALSLLGAIAYLLLVILTASKLQKRA